MPNWIEGTLKLRGKHDNIHRFIKEAIMPSRMFGVIVEKEYVIDRSDDEDIDVTIKNEPYIAGTRRMFIQDCDVRMWGVFGVAVFDIKQAWSFSSTQEDLETLQKIAHTYDVDVRLYGIERGMEFTQEVIVTAKGVEKNEVKVYEDWDWECPFPNMGG